MINALCCGPSVIVVRLADAVHPSARRGDGRLRCNRQAAHRRGCRHQRGEQGAACARPPHSSREHRLHDFAQCPLCTPPTPLRRPRGARFTARAPATQRGKTPRQLAKKLRNRSLTALLGAGLPRGSSRSSARGATPGPEPEPEPEPESVTACSPTRLDDGHGSGVIEDDDDVDDGEPVSAPQSAPANQVPAPRVRRPWAKKTTARPLLRPPFGAAVFGRIQCAPPPTVPR